MAAKKITVLDDSSEESLDPEQKKALEQKIDEMLDPEEPAAAKEETTPYFPENESTPEVGSAGSASPLPAKKPGKITITDGNIDSEAAAAGLAPEQLPAEALHIDLPAATDKPASKRDKKSTKTAADTSDEPSPETVPPDEEAAPADTEDSPETIEDSEVSSETAEPEASLPEDKTEAQTPANEDVATEVADEASTRPEEAEAEASAEEPVAEPKKYRPPDGPLPFKRAQPEPAAKPAAAGMVDDATARNVSAQLAEEAHTAAIPEPAVAKPVRPKRTRRSQPFLVVVLLLLLLIVAAAVIRPLRALALNLAHVHSSVAVQLVDNTRTPLSNVTVHDGAVQAVTDQNGRATLSNLKLGNQTLTFQKPGYASASKQIFVDWRPAPTQTVALTISGQQYSFSVTNYLSGKPVSGAKANIGPYSATSDAKGGLQLVADKSQVQDKTVSIAAPNYLTRQVSLPSGGLTAINLVPSGYDYYIAKQNGRYNLYRSTVDGQQVKLILAGTGNETSQQALVPNTDGTLLAWVSTRDAQRDKAGYLLSALTLITPTGSPTTLQHAQQLDVIGWFGSRLVYSALKADTSTTDTTRYQLLSYDTATKKTTLLAQAAGFNDILSAQGLIYYAPTGSNLYQVKPDGSDQQTLLSHEVTSIVRSDYNDLLFMTNNGYYSYKLGTSGKPSATNSTFSGRGRLYVDSPDGRHSVWLDTTNDKIMLYTKATNSEQSLATIPDLSYPIYWLNNSTLIYRTSNSLLNSDYALSLDGGSAKRIGTVFNAGGLQLWRD